MGHQSGDEDNLERNELLVMIGDANFCPPRPKKASHLHHAHHQAGQLQTYSS